MLCNKHYLHITRHGRILPRTRFDKNEIIDKKEYCEIKLYNKNKISLIDSKYKNIVKKYKWRLSDQGYAICDKIRLHQLIIGGKIKGLDIDHINRNKLDNREKNLRYCTRSENMHNRKGTNKGVNYRKNKKRWIANITIDNNTIHLGSYKEEKDAMESRKKAEEKYFPGQLI